MHNQAPMLFLFGNVMCGADDVSKQERRRRRRNENKMTIALLPQVVLPIRILWPLCLKLSCRCRRCRRRYWLLNVRLLFSNAHLSRVLIELYCCCCCCISFVRLFFFSFLTRIFAIVNICVIFFSSLKIWYAFLNLCIIIKKHINSVVLVFILHLFIDEFFFYDSKRWSKFFALPFVFVLYSHLFFVVLLSSFIVCVINLFRNT